MKIIQIAVGLILLIVLIVIGLGAFNEGTSKCVNL